MEISFLGRLCVLPGDSARSSLQTLSKSYDIIFTCVVVSADV